MSAEETVQDKNLHNVNKTSAADWILHALFPCLFQIYRYYEAV